MLRHSRIVLLIAVQTASLTLATSVLAVRPSEILLPDTTKGYFSVLDVDQFKEKFDLIGIGQLANDSVMEPFIKDLRSQLKRKMSDAGVSLGITIEDLDGVFGGEACVAAIQPNGDVQKHAIAILVDVTGHVEQADQLLAKVSKSLADQGGKKTTFRVGDAEVVGFVMPKQRDRVESPRRFYTVYKNQLIAVDDEQTCRDILLRFSGEPTDSLASVESFRKSMQRCDEAVGDVKPHARWFVDPFGLVEVMRAADNRVRRRGTDMLKVLSNQGFRAIQGAGGYAVLATEQHEEILAHMYIHAPGSYKLAARLLEFPNSSELAAQAWIPRSCALFLSYKWNMRDAFEYSKTLVDEIAGDEIFDEVLKQLDLDINGPQINVRKGLVAYLSDRATLLTDYRLPINAKSERYAFAIELTQSELVRETIDKAMKTDPDAKKRVFNGNVVWEVINDSEELMFGPAVDGPPGFGPFGAGLDEEEDEEPVLPNSAVTVTNRHLIIASHVDYVRDLLNMAEGAESLGRAVDYGLVNEALQKRNAGTDSFRLFVRTDEAVRPTYDLIRQGKMPESEMMLGVLLNEVFGPEEKGVLREQQVDGSKLPDYDAVRRYLGPAGGFVRSEKGGWFMTGCLLSKEATE